MVVMLPSSLCILLIGTLLDGPVTDDVHFGHVTKEVSPGFSPVKLLVFLLFTYLPTYLPIDSWLLLYSAGYCPLWPAGAPQCCFSMLCHSECFLAPWHKMFQAHFIISLTLSWKINHFFKESSFLLWRMVFSSKI